LGVAWGVVSTAHINRLVLAGARASAEADVIAVASRDEARAQAYAREHGIERAYGSYEALLADPDVEAVYISLPNAPHVEWSIRALEAGKHVLCEKPLSRHPEEVERAFDAADRAGRLLMEAFMYRHHPQTLRLQELVDGGAIGALRLIRATFSFPLVDGANVRLRRDLQGGALMDVGCYCVSAARLLAGEPERVHAEQVLGGDGVDVRLAATMRFGGDVLAQFDAALVLPDRDELEVVGDAGALFLEDPWHCHAARIELRRADGVEVVTTGTADAYRLELENLGDAIRGRAAPLLGRADAVGQARAIAALLRSADEGAPIAL